MAAAREKPIDLLAERVVEPARERLELEVERVERAERRELARARPELARLEVSPSAVRDSRFRRRGRARGAARGERLGVVGGELERESIVEDRLGELILPLQ